MLTAVWLDLDIVVELLTDVINADARFLMGDIADVRMIAGLCLVTGLAAVAGVCIGMLLTLQSLCKGVSEHASAGAGLAINDICMGNVPCLNGCLEVFLCLLLSNDIFKICHKCLL